MKIVLLITILFSINALPDSIYIKNKGEIDWRDEIKIHFQEDHEFSIVKLLNQEFEVRSQSQLLLILLKLQAKEINASSIAHHNYRVTDIQLMAN